ncbi:MAG: molecular chaperone DnaK, partial [Clostridiales bacterium]
AKAELKNALEGDDADVIKEKLDAMYAVLHKASERVYGEMAQQQQAAGGDEAGAQGEANQANPDDDVVDADYTVVDEDDTKK